MSRRLTGDEHHRTTDHSDEIEFMYSYADMLAKGDQTSVVETAVGNLPVGVMRTIYAAAAALLDVHDATGISLDDWTGPRELVELALTLGVFPTSTFLPNGV